MSRHSLPPTKIPLTRVYVFYMRGAPLFAFESQDDEDKALQLLKEGLELPVTCAYELREAVTVPTADLERLKLMMELKTAMFAVSQIAEAVRAGKAGLFLARPGDLPPRN